MSFDKMSFDEVVSQFDTDESGRILIRPEELKALLKDSRSVHTSAVTSTLAKEYENETTEGSVHRMEAEGGGNAVAINNASGDGGKMAASGGCTKSKGKGRIPHPPSVEMLDQFEQRIKMKSERHGNEKVGAMKIKPPVSCVEMLDQFEQRIQTKAEREGNVKVGVGSKHVQHNNAASIPGRHAAASAAVVQSDQQRKEQMKKNGNEGKKASGYAKAMEINPPPSSPSLRMLDQFEQRIRRKEEGEGNEKVDVGSKHHVQHNKVASIPERHATAAAQLMRQEQRLQEKMERENKNHAAKVKSPADTSSIDAAARDDGANIPNANMPGGSTPAQAELSDGSDGGLKLEKNEAASERRIQKKIDRRVNASAETAKRSSTNDDANISSSDDTVLTTKARLNQYDERIQNKSAKWSSTNDDTNLSSPDDTTLTTKARLNQYDERIQNKTAERSSTNNDTNLSSSDDTTLTTKARLNQHDERIQNKLDRSQHGSISGDDADSVDSQNTNDGNQLREMLYQRKDSTISESYPDDVSGVSNARKSAAAQSAQQLLTATESHPDDLSGVSYARESAAAQSAQQLLTATESHPDDISGVSNARESVEAQSSRQLTRWSSLLTAESQWTCNTHYPSSWGSVESGSTGMDDWRDPEVHGQSYLDLPLPANRADTRGSTWERRPGRRGPVLFENEDDVNQNNNYPRRRSSLTPTLSAFRRMTNAFALTRSGGVRSLPLVTAHLVEEEPEGQVVVAQRMNFFERKWRMIVSLSVCLLLGILAVSLAVLLTMGLGGAREGGESIGAVPEAVPSMRPSSALVFDLRPTLEMVQARGHVRCGFSNQTIESKKGLRYDLCRSIAAVLFGDPDSFVGVLVSATTRFRKLNERAVDVLMSEDTHTIEREVREKTTRAKFTFSSPYTYDGMAYLGNKTLVECAEEQTRFNECSNLRICVNKDTTSYQFVRSSFPPANFEAGSSGLEIEEMFLNGTCNVIANDRSSLPVYLAATNDDSIVLGEKLQTKEPLAVVTRSNNREFSDIINWVVQALFYGVEQGITKDMSRCRNVTNLTSSLSDLNFLNAVYCVGNYGEINDGDQSNRGMENINNGSTGMLYATPFGDLEKEYDDAAIVSSLLNDLRNQQSSFNCGVVVPDGSTEGKIMSDQLVGMSNEYCRTLAVAIFNGNSDAVNIIKYSESDQNGLVALGDRTIDVLAGASVNRRDDFESIPSLGGFQFSAAYYYGYGTSGDDVSFISVATREDDAQFSSFVNCVVLAMIYAEEIGIDESRSKEMPLVSIFGSDFSWALRDAIAYSGSYDQVFTKNFVDAAEDRRGRNSLNKGGPQIHSFPGLSPVKDYAPE